MGSSASLDRKPGSNWVQETGELPAYVREIARSIEKDGKSLEQAIPIAISRIKAWASGVGNVTPATQAKAAKALAEWEALKSRNKARTKGKAALSWVDDLDAAADIVVLSAYEDLMLRLSVERSAGRSVMALSQVLGAVTR